MGYLTILGILSIAPAIADPFRIEASQADQPTPLDTNPASNTVTQPAGARLDTAYGKLPYAFEANQGQSDGAVKFLARGPGYSLFLTPSGAVLTLIPARPETGEPPLPRTRSAEDVRRSKQTTRPAVLRLKLVGANPSPNVLGEDVLPGKVNYFRGQDPEHWRTGIPTYAKVRYQGVYPGIDLVYYGTQRQLEYDLVVAPGADPSVVRLAFTGADAMRLDGQGNLVLSIGGGEVIQHSPQVYQERDGQRSLIPTRYVLADAGQVSLELASYDSARALVIDPVLVYSTYLGGNAEDDAFAITVDQSGSAYVTGLTNSPDFPTTADALQPEHAPWPPDHDGGKRGQTTVSRVGYGKKCLTKRMSRASRASDD